MKVLLFEQWHGGHYANYMNCLVPEMARLSGQLFIAVNAAMRDSNRELERWRVLPNVTLTPALHDVRPELSGADRYAATRNLIHCLRTLRPDFTLLPSADAQATGLAALNALGWNAAKRFGPIEGTMHYGYGYSAATASDRMKEWVYSRTFRCVPFTSVNFVSFAGYEYVAAKRLIEPERLRFVGDPVPQPKRIGRAAARRLLGLEPGGRYLGLIGALDRRKAIPELLSAFRAAQLAPDDRLLLGGRLDPAFASLVATKYGDLVRDGRIVLLDRFLSDRELESGYEALDVATIVYHRYPGLSSLALKAIAAGTPLVVQDFGWLRAIVRRFEIGVACDVADQSAFISALRAALERGRSDEPSESTRRLLCFHTEDNFVARMTTGLARAAGGLGRPLTEWDWVLDALPPQRRGLF
jgi:glycosyltransferase involved in cell wall biosynthesis